MNSIIITEGSNKAKNRVLTETIRKFNVPFLTRTDSKSPLNHLNEEPIISIYGKVYNWEAIASMPDSDLNQILGYKLVSVEKAKNIVNSSAIINSNYLPIDEIPVDSVIVEDIKSKVNHPLYPTSMRDGYGWNTKWNKNDKVIVRDKSIYAENGELLIELGENETVYITTGGRVPLQFDSIIMIENVTIYREGPTVTLVAKTAPTKPGTFIRGVGSDVKEGEMLVSKGTQLSPYHLGLLMSANVKEIPVYTSPEIYIFSTGNEIVDVGVEGGIVDINSHMISSRLRSISNNVNREGILKDNLEEMKKVLSPLTGIIITSGGASVGEHDYTKTALIEMGYKIHFCKVHMMPGKPFTFATRDTSGETSYFFSLPGNPVAASVLTELFIVPFVKKLNGVEKYENDIIKANIDFDVDVNKSDPRPDYQRVYLVRTSTGIVARSTGQQTSSTIKSMCGADGMICVDRKINRGELVDVILINKLKRIREESVVKEEIKEERVVTDKKFPTIGVLTASDRASQGIYEDVSGKNIMAYLDREYGKDNYILIYRVLPDELEEIKKILLQMVNLGCCLILTTGGSGPSLRDVTTLATKEIMDKELPGFGEEMRRISLKYVPTAILSGQTAGIIYRKDKIFSDELREASGNSNEVRGEKKGTLIVNLPGSPRSINECLDAVFPAIPYCIELMGWEWIETKSGWKPKGK
jgi:molybdopterin adenylyltransferase